jgi:hypothetical protein
MHLGYWWESHKERDHWEEQDVGGWTIVKWILVRLNEFVWIGLIWLRIGTSGGLLWTRQWTSGFHKMLGSSWVAVQLAASQEGFSSMSEWMTEHESDWSGSGQSQMACFCECDHGPSGWGVLSYLMWWPVRQYNRRFGRTYCLNHLDRIIRHSTSKQSHLTAD